MEKMRKSEERLKKKEVDRMLMLDFRRLSTGMKQEEIQKTKVKELHGSRLYC